MKRLIPKQPQKSVFKLRESCRISTIVSALVLEIQRHLRSWKCGALARLKNRFLRLFGYIMIAIFSSLNAYTSKETFAKYPNHYFVETGSYEGDGIQMAIDVGFPQIYSIELQESLYENCCLRFVSSPQVKLFLGDSSNQLSLVLQEIDAPATFWLDGHYSAGITAKGKTNTPLLKEIEQIGEHHIKTHTILIDDIRQFGTTHMDFITLEEVQDKIRSINPNYEFRFEDGFIPQDVLVAFIPRDNSH